MKLAMSLKSQFWWSSPVWKAAIMKGWFGFHAFPPDAVQMFQGDNSLQPQPTASVARANGNCSPSNIWWAPDWWRLSTDLRQISAELNGAYFSTDVHIGLCCEPVPQTRVVSHRLEWSASKSPRWFHNALLSTSHQHTAPIALPGPPEGRILFNFFFFKKRLNKGKVAGIIVLFLKGQKSTQQKMQTKIRWLFGTVPS